MRIAAHTMGTPELTSHEAIDLFSTMGYDGIEFVVQEGFPCGPFVDWSDSDRRALRLHCLDASLRVACLAPYVTDINSLDEETGEAQLRLLRECVALARDLDAPTVRLFGGRQVPREEWERSAGIAAERLRSVAGLCRETGVKIAVENHYGTIASTAAETAALVRAVGAPEIGVLYDQANITHVRAESWRDAIRAQGGHILHVHAKDMVFVDGVGEEDFSRVTNVPKEKRAVRAVLLGEGVIPWPEMVPALKEAGYSGYLSVEYTRKWYPEDLPAAEIGMKHCLRYLRSLTGQA